MGTRRISHGFAAKCHSTKWSTTNHTERLPFVWKNPEIPGRIQMERFIPVEIFGKKSNNFRGITFFPFLPKRPKFSVPFVSITSARLHPEKAKTSPVFGKWYNSIPFLFSVPKKKQYHLTEIFHRNFPANCKRSLCSAPLILLIGFGVFKACKGQDLWSWICLQCS